MINNPLLIIDRANATETTDTTNDSVDFVLIRSQFFLVVEAAQNVVSIACNLTGRIPHNIQCQSSSYARLNWSFSAPTMLQLRTYNLRGLLTTFLWSSKPHPPKSNSMHCSQTTSTLGNLPHFDQCCPMRQQKSTNKKKNKIQPVSSPLLLTVSLHI